MTEKIKKSLMAAATERAETTKRDIERLAVLKECLERELYKLSAKLNQINEFERLALESLNSNWHDLAVFHSQWDALLQTETYDAKLLNERLAVFTINNKAMLSSSNLYRNDNKQVILKIEKPTSKEEAFVLYNALIRLTPSLVNESAQKEDEKAAIVSINGSNEEELTMFLEPNKNYLILKNSKNGPEVLFESSNLKNCLNFLIG